MEHYGGLPINSPEIEPLERETYVTLEQSILDEIIRHAREDGMDGPVTAEYLRISELDAQAECVRVLLTPTESRIGGVVRMRYDITTCKYKSGVIPDACALKDASDADVRAYSIALDGQYADCHTYADFATGTRIGRHRMNAVEHSTLLDELLAVRTWQLAAQNERAILSK